jgi:hypothetical protein
MEAILRTPGKRNKRFLAGFLAAAMAISVSPLVGGGIAQAETLDATGPDSFCEDAPTENPFPDVSAEDPALQEIICQAADEVGISVGFVDGTFRPNATTSRRQMALFMVRLADLMKELEAEDGTLNELPEYDGENRFTDSADENDEVVSAINRLAEAGIVLGTTPTTYNPGADVTRRQMLLFITRLIEFVTGAELDEGDGADFPDQAAETAEVQEATDKLFEAGVVEGRADGTFGYGAAITRRQMTWFNMRTAELHFQLGLIVSPFEPATPATATDAPELVSVTHLNRTVNDGSLACAASPAPLELVAFNFDSAIDAVSSTTAFFINPPDMDWIGSCDARVNPGNTNQVIAVFEFLDGDKDVYDGTSGSVGEGAVVDIAARENPEGSAPFTSPRPLSNGQTFSADLLTIGNCRAEPGANPEEILVDFTFDEQVTDASVVPGLFNIVLSGGIVVFGNEQSNAAGTTIGLQTGNLPVRTIWFDVSATGDAYDPDGAVANPSFTPAQACGQLARGYVETGAVQDLGLTANPQQATAGSTNSPDVTGFSIDPVNDRATLTFSENVSATLGLPGDFQVYDLEGTEISPTSVTRPAAAPNSVVMQFTAGQITNATVGGSVDECGVVAFAAPQRCSRVDSAGTSSIFAPGSTLAPVLVDVSVTVRTDAFNNPVGHNVIWTFDKPIDINNQFFSIYNEEGVRTELAGCVEAAPADPANNVVVCPTSTNTLADTAAQNAVLGAIDYDAVETALTGVFLDAVSNYEDSVVI